MFSDRPGVGVCHAFFFRCPLRRRWSGADLVLRASNLHNLAAHCGTAGERISLVLRYNLKFLMVKHLLQTQLSKLDMYVTLHIITYLSTKVLLYHI